MNLTELPVDIIFIIINRLDARDFLSFCRTCKAFYQPDIRFDSAYWAYVTRENFRLPIRPAFEGDGQKWHKLYKRLLTQTSVYTWGKNDRGCLGRAGNSEACNPLPLPVEGAKELGIVSDMQCGGWSTSFLTSQGLLYTTGVLDGETYATAPERALQGKNARMKFPPGYPAPEQRDHPNISGVTIRQFSAGRKHILALADEGRIWSWYSHAQPALQVKFLHTDINVSGGHNDQSKGIVKQVLAGWNKSSAYIYGTGIVIWNVARPRPRDNADEMDTMLIADVATVPATSFRPLERKQRPEQWKTEDDSEQVGSVMNWVLLEGFIVFITDIGRVYAALIEFSGNTIVINKSLEITTLRSTEPYPKSFDIQGSFRSFAIFMNGKVTVLPQEWLQNRWNENQQENLNWSFPENAVIPALQNSGVQQLAFGDWHFHALHSNGTITSYGREPRSCGALGLGGRPGKDDRVLRGLLTGINHHEAPLVPEANTTGRRVWFDTPKQQWLQFLSEGGADPEEAKGRLDIIRTRANGVSELSEWVEQKGKDWDRFLDTPNADEDGLGAHFALNICAAGWHSGALVLVNEKLAEKIRERGPFWSEDKLPRLRLTDGSEMPGTIDITEL